MTFEVNEMDFRLTMKQQDSICFQIFTMDISCGGFSFSLTKLPPGWSAITLKHQQECKVPNQDQQFWLRIFSFVPKLGGHDMRFIYIISFMSFVKFWSSSNSFFVFKIHQQCLEFVVSLFWKICGSFFSPHLTHHPNWPHRLKHQGAHHPGVQHC